MLRTPKKSETIEVRLPHPTKMAFVRHCHARGWTISGAVRSYIDQELAGSGPRRMRWLHILAAALAGLAMGATAAPTLAQSMGGDRASFDRIDRDGDGRVSFQEYQAR